MSRRSSVVTHIKASVSFEHETQRNCKCMHSFEIVLLWDRSPYALVDTYHCFGGTCHEKLRSHTQFWLETRETL